MNFGTTKIRPPTNSTFNYSDSDMRPIQSEEPAGNRDPAQEDLSQEALEASIFQQEGSAEKSKNKSPRRNAWGYCSYAQMIAYAISTSPHKRLTLNEIYDWMIDNIAYFRERSDKDSSKGWKNSIRHNLSLHGRFKRIINDVSGKSSWWIVCAEERTKKQTNSKKAKKDASDVYDGCNTHVNPNIHQFEMSNSQYQMNIDNQYHYYMYCEQKKQQLLQKQHIVQQQITLIEQEQQKLLGVNYIYNQSYDSHSNERNGATKRTKPDVDRNNITNENKKRKKQERNGTNTFIEELGMNIFLPHPTCEEEKRSNGGAFNKYFTKYLTDELKVQNVQSNETKNCFNEVTAETNSTRRSQQTISPPHSPLHPPPAIPNPLYRPRATVGNANVGTGRTIDGTPIVSAEVAFEQSEVSKPNRTRKQNEEKPKSCEPSRLANQPRLNYAEQSCVTQGEQHDAEFLDGLLMNNAPDSFSNQGNLDGIELDEAFRNELYNALHDYMPDCFAACKESHDS